MTLCQSVTLTISFPDDSGEALLATSKAILAGVSKKSSSVDDMATMLIDFKIRNRPCS